jgi:hypothetical protein
MRQKICYTIDVRRKQILQLKKIRRETFFDKLSNERLSTEVKGQIYRPFDRRL